MGIHDRLRRLEARLFPKHGGCLYRSDQQMNDYIDGLERRGWSADDQVADLMLTQRIRRLGGKNSKRLSTDRELFIIEELIDAELLPEDARDYFDRMAPAEQPKREAWLFEKREWSKADREAHEEWNEWAKLHGRYPIPDHIQAKFLALEGAQRRRNS